MEPGDLAPEQVFLRYAFPCAHLILEDKRISQKQFEYLRRAALKGERIPKLKLEKIFPAAFRRLKETSAMSGLDYWSVEAVRNYFRNHHEDYIKANDGSYKMFGPTLKDLCRVRKARIARIIRKGIGEAKVGNSTRPVFLNLVPDAKPGDEVYIHYAYAVEKA